MADWPDLGGKLLADGGHELAVRVYYEDTDFSGAVYHANYLKFCERGRSDFLRLKNVHHYELAAQMGGGFVVRHMICDFLSPARIDDLLVIKTHIVEISGARLELAQKVEREGAVLFQAQVKIALVDGRGRPQRLPQAVLALGQPN
jgi:acyl-CoA thioester hydrolase